MNAAEVTTLKKLIGILEDRTRDSLKRTAIVAIELRQMLDNDVAHKLRNHEHYPSVNRSHS